jgi:hypothetical protein
MRACERNLFSYLFVVMVSGIFNDKNIKWCQRRCRMGTASRLRRGADGTSAFPGSSSRSLPWAITSRAVGAWLRPSPVVAPYSHVVNFGVLRFAAK